MPSHTQAHLCPVRFGCTLTLGVLGLIGAQLGHSVSECVRCFGG